MLCLAGHPWFSSSLSSSCVEALLVDEVWNVSARLSARPLFAKEPQNNAVDQADGWRPSKGAPSNLPLLAPLQSEGGGGGLELEAFLDTSHAFATLSGGDREAVESLEPPSTPRSSPPPSLTPNSVTFLCDLRAVARWLRRNGFDTQELRRPNVRK
jgi:hypothetical protein